MSGETKMSIAVNEAERIWQPSQVSDAPYDRDARIRAYVRGRTAEPCEEQMEAALAERNRHLFYHTDDGVDLYCCCGAVIRDGWASPNAVERHVTLMMLEAARKAVM